MKVLTVQQMQNAEALAVKKGMTYMRLMENAGASCARYIYEKMRANKIATGKVTVLCGSGKNAGDGLVIARKLKQSGSDVTVVFAFDRLKAQETIEMYSRADGLNIRYYRLSAHPEESEFEIKSADVIVDAVFGIGFSGEIDASLKKMFRTVNSSKGTVFSIDVPSGISAESEVTGEYIKPDYTIAIAALKSTHIMNIAKLGIVNVVDIGIPEDCMPENVADVIIPTNDSIRHILPIKSENAHKGDFGRAVLIVGSTNFQGAAVLSGNACVKSGAGITQLIFPKDAYSAIAPKVTEPILLPLSSNSQGTLSVSSRGEIVEAVKKADAVLIGCGIGDNDDTNDLVYEVIRNTSCPLVIDADGINAVAKNINILNEAKCPIIMTPHVGEMSRLVGKKVLGSVSERIITALEFTEKYNVTLVLKGANTVVVRKNIPVFINNTGNNGMATGGSGDALAGIITSLLAQGAKPFPAASAGVYIHGLAGDKTAERLSKRGMTPTDLVNELPYIYKFME